PQRAFERAIERPGNVSPAEAQTLLFGDHVINLDRVLPRVRKMRIRHDVVRGSLLETRRGQRIRRQQRLTVPANAIRADDVSLEEPAGSWVVYDDSLFEKKIPRVEQFAQIAVSHREAWDRAGRSLAIATLDPLFCPEEEHFRFFALRYFWDEHGAA